MIHFSESLTAILQASGWSPERQVNLAPIEERFKARGFSLHPSIRPIVSAFDGLKLRSPNGGWIKFDAEWAANVYNSEDLRFLESITGGPLSPLGQLSCSGFFGSHDGKIFALDIDWILIGSARNIEEFLREVLLRDAAALPTVYLKAEQMPERMR